MIGSKDNVSIVTIRTHAKHTRLGFGDSSDDKMDLDMIDVLECKNIDTLILISCNSGHRSVEKNVASCFAKKTGGNVWASDGTVSSMYSPVLSFLSGCTIPYGLIIPQNDNSFMDIQVESGCEQRDVKGWCLYRYCNGKIIVMDKANIRYVSVRELIKYSHAKGSRYEQV